MTTNIAVFGKDIGKRAHWAWYLFDFGNSAYAAWFVLAVYSAYFQDTVVGGAEGSRPVGIAIGIAMLIGATISPILATIADFTAKKKRFLLVFSTLSWVFTALLFLCKKVTSSSGWYSSSWPRSVTVQGRSSTTRCFPISPHQKRWRRVSGNGWAIGSAGGIICLLLILPFIVMIKGALGRAGFAGIHSAVFCPVDHPAVPARQRDRPCADAPAGPKTTPRWLSSASGAPSGPSATSGNSASLSSLSWFTTTVLTCRCASPPSSAQCCMALNQQQLIILIILVQVTSIVGAYVLRADWRESRPLQKGLLISLVLMIAAVRLAVFQPLSDGYFVTRLAGRFALTGVQSVSRTVAQPVLAPQRAKRAEFFSFFAVAGKASSWSGRRSMGSW